MNRPLFQKLLLFIRSWPAGQALLFFTVISGLMLFPIFPHLFDRLVLGGDAYEYVWKLWWLKHSYLETGQSLWLVPQIYYPQGYLLAYGESTIANTLLALPSTVLLGEIPTYNLLILLSTILSGFTMFLLAREVSGNFFAGLLAGAIFAFAPFRRLQLLHLNIATTQWLPLIFYFLERFARTRKPVFGAAAGVSFALNALASWYYAVAGTLFVLVWGLVRFRPLKNYLRHKQTWLALGLFSIIALSLIVPFAWPYLALLGNPDIAIPIENVNFYSASLTDYLMPSPFQFLWGGWVSSNLLRRTASGEFIVSSGFMALLFAFYGLRLARPSLTRPWLAVALVALVLSFGLTFHLIGRQLTIPAPRPVVNTVNALFNTISLEYALEPEPFTISQANGLVIPLPALVLRWFVPVIGKLRTWTRFGIITLFGLAVLAALGAAAWHQRELVPHSSPLKQRLSWLLVIGLTLFELWWAPLPMISPTLERPVDRWLAAQPDQFAIMEYPLSSALTPQQLIYTRAHGKPIVHGYATYFSFVFSRQQPELLEFPDKVALQRLTELGVRYVLVETAVPYAAEAQTLLTAINQESCLQQRTVQATIVVFELVGCTQAHQAEP